MSINLDFFASLPSYLRACEKHFARFIHVPAELQNIDTAFLRRMVANREQSDGESDTKPAVAPKLERRLDGCARGQRFGMRQSNREASHAKAAARPHTNGAEALIWWIGSLLVRAASRAAARPC